VKSLLWKLLYPRWTPLAAPPSDGLTLLVLIPGDLPVFLDLALDVCARQQCPALRHTLIIPDVVTPELRRRVADRLTTWPHGSIALVDLRPIDRLLIKRLKNPHHNVWLQFFRGIEATTTTHAVWHDADLFLTDPTLLQRQYDAITRGGLDCLGVSPVWDAWYRERGFDKIAATWELTFSTTWARTFAPWQHHGHEATINGEKHVVDITLLPQVLTAPERLSVAPITSGFVHFNYVICTYRWFQNSTGPYEDDKFRLLLVRLLVDAFDQGNWPYEVPPAADLARGLSDPTSRVTYVKPETLASWPEFRVKFQDLLQSTLLTDSQRSALARGLRPFDDRLGVPSAPVTPPPA
jgi:hypothetical protein